MEKIRVMIAEDSDFVRDGMRIILSVDHEFEVVGCAENGSKALELAETNQVDVILMDIQMPVMDGIEATKIITEKGLGKVLILTTFDDYDLVKRAIKNGAKGYIIKNNPPDMIKQMIKSVHNGVNILDEQILEKITDSDVYRNTGFDRTPYTAREMDIVEAISEGLSNKEIVEKLFISEGTVKNHISAILEKGALSHRTQLAVYYLTGKK